jgi:predicted nucleotidyltransferase
LHVTSPILDRAEAVMRLARCEPEIRALGVSWLALFGSVVRDQVRPDSDIDVLVRFAPGAKTYDRFLALSELLEHQLGRRVELVTTEALSPFIGPRILAEALDVLRAA